MSLATQRGFNVFRLPTRSLLVTTMMDAEPSPTNDPGAASTSAGGNLGTRGFQYIAGFFLLINYAI